MPAKLAARIICNILIILRKYDRRSEAGCLSKGEKNAYWNFSPVSDYCSSFFLLILTPKRAGLFESDWHEGCCLFVTYQWGKPQVPCSFGAGGNAEGARSIRLLRNPLLINR
jgi:hypothetical protein